MRNYSTITQVQALSLDFHFLIEQKAKSNSDLFMNFNGTAGIWRRDCVVDAGGWHIATLVEDLDLSYRAQMKGWKCVFLPDIVVDAELPAQMNAGQAAAVSLGKGLDSVCDKTAQRHCHKNARSQSRQRFRHSYSLRAISSIPLC